MLNKNSERFKIFLRAVSEITANLKEMKGFIFLSILQIRLDDVISGKAIFAHLTKTKALLKNLNGSIS